MDYQINQVHLIWALAIGGLSAVSLPLGSLVGLSIKLPRWLTGSLAAFGGGALIAALSVELVAPTVGALTHEGDHHAQAHFINLILGSVLGGLLFVGLNQVINAQGGFLRRTSTTIQYFTKKREEYEQHILEDLSQIDLIRLIPKSEVRQLIDVIRLDHFAEGDVLFKQGDRGDRMLFLRSGSVELLKDGKVFKTLEEGTVVGEIALITETPRTMTVKALNEVEVLVLRKEDFDHLRKQLPELDRAAREMASERLEQISAHQREQSAEQEEWIQQTADALRTGAVIPSSEDLKHEVEAHHGAPLAIWMGILLDGIPESFVIGAGFLFLLVNKSAGGMIDQIGLADAIPYTLVAGLFLSNFPEALSSSAGMKSQGWSKKRILFLWFILMVFTSLGAALGYVAGASVAGETIALIEGIAAGAMLTMIASAMIPEAVHMGGANNVGISTLLGFLAAISFKLLE